MLNLDAIDASLEKMTPGDWEAGAVLRDCDHSPGYCYFDEQQFIFPPNGDSIGLDYQPGGPVALISVGEFSGNAEGIVLLRNTAREMIAEIRRLREGIERAWQIESADSAVDLVEVRDILFSLRAASKGEA